MARSEVRRIRLSDIIPDPNNPRKNFDEEKLESLAASFVANGGEPFIPPIVVPCGGGKYHIADGERRYRAMVMAGQVEEASFIVSEDADEAYSLASMLATDLKEPLSSEEKAVGVQQALMYGMDLGTVDAVASIPRGSAEKVKQVIEYRDDPVQTSLDALFKIAEIDGTLERDQLLDLAEDHENQDRFRRELGKAKSLQENRKVREEMLEVLGRFGVSVIDQAPVSGEGFKRAVSVHGNVERLGSFLSGSEDTASMVATASYPDEHLSWTKDRFDPIECIVYVPVEEDDDDDSIMQAERDARREEYDDEAEGIQQDWASFLFTATMHPEGIDADMRERICSCWNTRFEVTEAAKKGYPAYSEVPDAYMFPFVLARFEVFSLMSAVRIVYVTQTQSDYYLGNTRKYLDVYDLAVRNGYEPHDFEMKLVTSLRDLSADEEDESTEADAVTCEECGKCDE